jgi:hypothetical protein
MHNLKNTCYRRHAISIKPASWVQNKIYLAELMGGGLNEMRAAGAARPGRGQQESHNLENKQ